MLDYGVDVLELRSDCDSGCLPHRNEMPAVMSINFCVPQPSEQYLHGLYNTVLDLHIGRSLLVLRHLKQPVRYNLQHLLPVGLREHLPGMSALLVPVFYLRDDAGQLHLLPEHPVPRPVPHREPVRGNLPRRLLRQHQHLDVYTLRLSLPYLYYKLELHQLLHWQPIPQQLYQLSDGICEYE